MKNWILKRKKANLCMAEELVIIEGDKETIYNSLIPQIEALIGGEKNIIANLANATAALHSHFNNLWTGFYLVEDSELVLGPFQGPIACTRIQLNKGVCGTSWANKETLIVENVDEFPGHIACSSLSKSEIVVPVIKNNEVVAVLDIDNENLAAFDTIDAKHLEKLCSSLSDLF